MGRVIRHRGCRENRRAGGRIASTTQFTHRVGRDAGLIAATIALIFGGCAPPSASNPGRPIIVYAAASSTDAVTEVVALYEAQADVQVTCSFASSSTLAQQISGGAVADVYLSANPEWMDWLEARDLIDPASRHDLLANELVLISPADSSITVTMDRSFNLSAALPQDARIAIGDPDHVPAGIYGKQALSHLRWWDSIQPRLVTTVDVRAALRLVELGEAEVGIVYSTDAAASERVKVIGRFPPDSHDRIRYPVATTAGAGEDAAEFVRFLTSSQAANVFRKHGFVLIAAEQ